MATFLTVAARTVAFLTTALTLATIAALTLATIAALTMTAFVAAAFAATAFVTATAFTLVAVTFMVATATHTVVARGFVLVEAGAPAGACPGVVGPCDRAARAEREKPDSEKCRQTLPHEGSFSRELWLVVSMARPAAVLGLVVAGPTVAFATLAFDAFATLGFTAVVAAFAATTFAAFTAVTFPTLAPFTPVSFFGFFAGAFVGDAEAFAVDARRRFRFFAGAFIGDASAFAMDARGFVLLEGGAPHPIASATASQGQRAAGAQHEQPEGEQGRKALPCQSTWS